MRWLSIARRRSCARLRGRRLWWRQRRGESATRTTSPRRRSVGGRRHRRDDDGRDVDRRDVDRRDRHVRTSRACPRTASSWSRRTARLSAGRRRCGRGAATSAATLDEVRRASRTSVPDEIQADVQTLADGVRASTSTSSKDSGSKPARVPSADAARSSFSGVSQSFDDARGARQRRDASSAPGPTRTASSGG